MHSASTFPPSVNQVRIYWRCLLNSRNKFTTFLTLCLSFWLVDFNGRVNKCIFNENQWAYKPNCVLISNRRFIYFIISSMKSINSAYLRRMVEMKSLMLWMNGSMQALQTLKRPKTFSWKFFFVADKDVSRQTEWK